MMKLTFLFILLFSFCSYGCEEVNLYETHANLNQLPIQNQGTLNTCYAQTLSTIYNLENSNPVDPFWIAFVHKIDGLHWKPRKLDYSMLSLAYGDLQKSGACDVSLVNEAYRKLKNGVNYSNNQLFYLLAEYFKNKNIDDLIEELPEKTLNDYEVPWKKADLEKILNPIAESARKKSLFIWLRENVFQSCRENLSVSFPEPLSSFGRGKETNDTLALMVEEILKENKAVAAGFCGKVFTNTDLRIKASPRLLKSIHAKCGAHYVTLVGSRKNGGSCEYLVRNSLGTGSWAHQDYTCYCKDKRLNKNRDCHKSELANPNLSVLGCWIDREALLTNTFDLSYLNSF